MQLKKLEIRNFYSARKIDVDFTNFSGLVLINGENVDTGGSNGAGKSLILEALTWGLFGKTIRKSTEEAMVNFDVKKNCSVTVYVDDLVITRTRRPTSLQVKKGEEIFTRESVPETQKELDTVRS